jgi:hypothetical protein
MPAIHSVGPELEARDQQNAQRLGPAVVAVHDLPAGANGDAAASDGSA